MIRNRIIHFTVLAAAILGFVACDKDKETEKPEKEEPTEIVKVEFVKGADISWVTEMEKDGQKFYNASGEEKECTALMKEIGFDAIRLRVWVDPDEGWCAKEDVLVKAKRVKELGLKLMIDFHYSDFFADPSKQNPPAAWKNYNSSQMVEAVASHTSEVLGMLKQNGIYVDWVQIGNEVNQGMLWPSGKISGQSAGSFVSLLNAGYDAVKDIYPNADIIVHISNGHDNGLFDWFFSLMQSNNARYDIIGMSLYPSWWENDGWCDWKANTDKCIANMKAVSSKFGKPVMLCEIGMPVSEPQMAKEAMQYILNNTADMDKCLGVFYWEPQTDGVWKPSGYTDLGWNAYNMGAFKDGKPTVALEPFKL